jgi:hypothetical protein
MRKKEKIGRNDFCPCGSGLKYKKCCLDKPKQQIKYNVPFPVLKELRRKKLENLFEEKVRKRKYGEVRPIINCNAPYGKLVAIGDKVYQTSLDADFHGFLLEHALHKMDESWIKAELTKPNGPINPICKWYYDTFTSYEEALRKPIKINLSFNPLLAFAYDLFVLDDHFALQNRVIKRLKYHDQFEGARYELYVAATMIRAGFSLSYEDEDDSSSRHVEFIATHKTSNETIMVEARRSNPKKHDYGAKINGAIKKAGNYPLVIFIDANLSPTKAYNYLKNTNPHLQQMLDNRINKATDGRDLFNLLILTNHPYDYASFQCPEPQNTYLILQGKAPVILPKDRRLLEIIKKAVEQYGNIPKHFPK